LEEYAGASDSSLSHDRILARIYGGSEIAAHGSVNLVDRPIEVYSLPYPGGYHSRQDFTPGQDLPLLIDGVEAGQIAVTDILP
jgi:hypothetical protein